jgi:type I restriction enzyme S subunit
MFEAESEIVLLRQRLTKARAIKSGVMQQLLTGRVRLPVEDAE